MERLWSVAKKWHQSRDYEAVHADIRRIGLAMIQAGALGGITHFVLQGFTDQTHDSRIAVASAVVMAVGVIVWVIGWPTRGEQEGGE